ncbi:MAG: hypothetical protein K0U93_07785 [Gammaproteobacteria bacterium]|nr:hypothetical protein [Gammaproteobacteria bacterium]
MPQRMSANPCRRLGRALAAMLLVWSHCADATPGALMPLTKLVSGAQWPGISQVIVYNRRVWFANSEPYADFNAADIYSYDPVSGSHRYEQQLFSQDAGEPVVFKGLLYWPFEDPRFSARRGEYLRTDGSAWQWREIRGAQAFHAHAMGGCGEHLLNGSGAWAGGIQSSLDAGRTWRADYMHPTYERKVSRILSFTALGQRCFAGLRAFAQPGAKLLEWTASGAVVPIPGADAYEGIRSLVTYQGAVYGIAMRAKRPTLVRLDGTQVHRLDAPPGDWVVSLGASEHGLFAITVEGGSGALWRRADGNWHLVHPFTDERPSAITVAGGAVFVGTYHKDGGSLWGPRPGHYIPRTNQDTHNTLSEPEAKSAHDLNERLNALDRALADPQSFHRLGSPLRDILDDVVDIGGAKAGHAVSARLLTPIANTRVKTFASPDPLSSQHVAQHHLLRAIGLIGAGYVPAQLLLAPWDQPDNPPAKYFHPTPAAIWTAGIVRQYDATTVNALLKRLQTYPDPDWIKGDIVGALSRITSRRHGYDATRWSDTP